MCSMPKIKPLKVVPAKGGAEKYFDVALKTGDYYKKGIGTWGGRGGGAVRRPPRGRRPFKPSIRGSRQATHNPFESREKCLNKGFTGDQKSSQ